MTEPEPIEHATIGFGINVRVEIKMAEPKADRLDQPDPEHYNERDRKRRVSGRQEDREHKP